jgi:hypothetical protein
VAARPLPTIAVHPPATAAVGFVSSPTTPPPPPLDRSASTPAKGLKRAGDEDARLDFKRSRTLMGSPWSARHGAEGAQHGRRLDTTADDLHAFFAAHPITPERRRSVEMVHRAHALVLVTLLPCKASLDLQPFLHYHSLHHIHGRVPPFHASSLSRHFATDPHAAFSPGSPIGEVACYPTRPTKAGTLSELQQVSGLLVVFGCRGGA